MASEESSAPEQTIGDRVVAFFDRIHDAYDDVVGSVRRYTPYVVRAVEVILAVALFALLTHWIYLFYTAG